MEKSFLNVISAYALDILRKNLTESGYIEPKEISSVTPKSHFGKDIKISDFLERRRREWRGMQRKKAGGRQVDRDVSAEKSV